MNEEAKHILQWENKQMVAQLGEGKWLTFPARTFDERGSLTIFPAFVPLRELYKVCAQANWEVWPGLGAPGCTVFDSYSENERTIYFPYGDENGTEPLLIRRNFHEMRPDYTEISQEFRLFHNLYFDGKNNKYLKFDDQGDEHEVIVLEGENIKIRVKHLRQFLAVKEMFLAIYFDALSFTKQPLQQLGLVATEKPQEVREADLIYDFGIGDTSGLAEWATVSSLIGKKLLFGCEKEKSEFWPFNGDRRAQKQYESFIIGVDDEEEPILHSCNPGQLANNFGSNPGSPLYLTPVFFERRVLEKYYADPSKYTISDNILYCGALWSLRMDNNHAKYVIAYLGDLGGDLSQREQLYWKSFNVVPDGRISDTELKRSFLAEFAEPEQADLRFKSAYALFGERWQEKHGWPLFKPLNPEDAHVLSALRIPLTRDFSEFDTQLLYLTKLLVDSLNDPKIVQGLGAVDKNTRSIGKLELMLRNAGATGYELHIYFLRDLYKLRSKGAGHRKGSDYGEIAAEFGVGEKDLPEIIRVFLDKATEMLKFLETVELPNQLRETI